MNLFHRSTRTAAQLLRLTLINAGVLVLIELLLKHWMGRNDIVSVLFAAGPHLSFTKLGLALCFVLVRLIVWLWLPGIIARHLFLWLTEERTR